MSNTEILRERIKNKDYEGFLNPGYETILTSLETMEVLKETLNQSFQILLDKAPDESSDAANCWIRINSLDIIMGTP